MLLFCQRLDLFILLQVGIKLCLVRVALRLDRLVDHVHEHRDVDRQRQRAAHGVDHGVIRAGDHLHAAILEQRERLGEHAPDRERLRAVLEPCSLAERERAERRSQQQREARIERVRRDAVIGIGEVPEVIRDDPEPEHIRPEHVAAAVELRLFANHDAEPARDGDDVEQSRDAVHDVPWASEHAGDFALDRAGVGEPVHSAHLEVAHARLEDVDREDQRREDQRPLHVGQTPLDLPRELVPLLQVPDEPEADAADGRGVHLHQMEPVGVGLVLHHGEPDDGERDGQHDKADEPGPFPATRDFVKNEQSREHRKPDCPNR